MPGETNIDGTGYFNCKKCTRRFFTKAGFVIHIRTHGSDLVSLLEQQQTLPQDSVTVVTQTKTEKQRTQKNQEIKKSTENVFTIHKQTNVDIKKVTTHQCEQCKKCFVNKYKLQYHINSVHLKLNPHKCQICQRGFREKDKLLNHVSFFHEKIILYKCHICQKGFGQKYGLQYHNNIVHEKLHFKCKKCDLSFVNTYRLQCHVKTVHEKLTYSPVCSEACVQKHNLKKHFLVPINPIKHNLEVAGLVSGDSLPQEAEQTIVLQKTAGNKELRECKKEVVGYGSNRKKKEPRNSKYSGRKCAHNER